MNITISCLGVILTSFVIFGTPLWLIAMWHDAFFNHYKMEKWLMLWATFLAISAVWIPLLNGVKP